MGSKKRYIRPSAIKASPPDWILSAAIMVVLLCMALPSVVKFNHAIRDHKELQCNADARTHYHASEIDCVFHKFKVAASNYPPLFVFEVFETQAYQSYELPCYIRINSLQPLPYSLRAPPSYS